jgi:hypothetical protein
VGVGQYWGEAPFIIEKILLQTDGEKISKSESVSQGFLIWVRREGEVSGCNSVTITIHVAHNSVYCISLERQYRVLVLYQVRASALVANFDRIKGLSSLMHLHRAGLGAE